MEEAPDIFIEPISDSNLSEIEPLFEELFPNQSPLSKHAAQLDQEACTKWFTSSVSQFIEDGWCFVARDIDSLEPVGAIFAHPLNRHVDFECGLSPDHQHILELFRKLEYPVHITIDPNSVLAIHTMFSYSRSINEVLVGGLMEAARDNGFKYAIAEQQVLEDQPSLLSEFGFGQEFELVIAESGIPQLSEHPGKLVLVAAKL